MHNGCLGFVFTEWYISPAYKRKILGNLEISLSSTFALPHSQSIFLSNYGFSIELGGRDDCKPAAHIALGAISVRHCKFFFWGGEF